MPGKGQAGYLRWRVAQVVSAIAAILLALLYVAFVAEAYRCHHDPGCDDYIEINYWGMLFPAALFGAAVAALFWRLAWPLVGAWGAIGVLNLGTHLYFLLPSVQEANGWHASVASVAGHMLRDPWVWAWVVVFLLALPALWNRTGQSSRMHDRPRQAT